MTDEELNRIIDEMVKHFGELPNPFQEPIRFAYFVKQYHYYKQRGFL